MLWTILTVFAEAVSIVLVVTFIFGLVLLAQMLKEEDEQTKN